MTFVQWIGNDGGWKTGSVVEIAGKVVTRLVERECPGFFTKVYLVKHDHTSKLEFVYPTLLIVRPGQG